MVKKKTQHKLGILSLGLAFGISFAIYIACIGIFNHFTGESQIIIQLISSIYIGFEVSPLGIIIGSFWGFIDGFVGGVIMAWLYNFFQVKLG